MRKSRDFQREAFESFRKSENKQRRAGHYDWLYNNNHLRDTINALIRARDIQKNVIAKEIKCHKSALSNYLNKSGNRKNLSNFHLLKLCAYLGIQISLKIELTEHGNWRKDSKRSKRNP